MRSAISGDSLIEGIVGGFGVVREGEELGNMESMEVLIEFIPFPHAGSIWDSARGLLFCVSASELGFFLLEESV